MSLRPSSDSCSAMRCKAVAVAIVPALILMGLAAGCIFFLYLHCLTPQCQWATGIGTAVIAVLVVVAGGFLAYLAYTDCAGWLQRSRGGVDDSNNKQDTSA